MIIDSLLVITSNITRRYIIKKPVKNTKLMFFDYAIMY